MPSDPGENHRGAGAADQREHRREIFVAHRPEDDHQRPVLGEFPNRRQRPFQAGGVVRAIDEHDRIAIDDLEAAGPAGPRQSVAQRAIGDIPAARAQGVDGGDCERRVVRLVQTQQREA